MGKEGFNGSDINIPKSSLDTAKEQFSDVDKNEETNNKNDNLSEELLNIQNEEKIDNEIGEILDELEVSKENKEKIYESILKFSDNEELFNSILLQITDEAYEESDIYKILEDIQIEQKKEEINEEKEEINEEKEEINEEKEEINEEKEEINDNKINEESIDEKISKETVVKQEKTEIKQEKDNEIQGENLIKQKEIIELKEKKAKLEKLSNSLSGLDGDGKVYGDILGRINNLNKNENNSNFEDEYQQVIDDLGNENNQHILNSLLVDLGKQGGNKLQNFKDSLIEIDESFRSKVDIAVPDSMPRIATGIGKTRDLDSSTGILDANKDGLNITVGKDGRKVGLEDGEYRLGAKIDNQEAFKEINQIEKRLKEDIKPINEQLNTISSIIKFVDKAISNNVDIKEVKEAIKTSNSELYTELNIESATSLQQIKNNFTELYAQKEEEKKKIIMVAKAKIENIISRNTEVAEATDSEKKEILTFLDDIAFSYLPQDLTNQLINEYKRNSLSIPGLNLNHETIDLKNARFGESVTDQGGDAWKNNLVKFMEKMIYGEIGGDNSIFKGKDFAGAFGAHIDPLEINLALESSGLKTGTGWNIYKMRENLSKEIVS